MSIRLKLILSYAAMLIIPLILIVLTALLLILVFYGDVQNIRDAYGTRTEQFDDRMSERLLKEIKRTTEVSPALFADAAYLDDLSQELNKSGSSLIVRKGDRLIYASNTREPADLTGHLPAFERPGHTERQPPEQVDNQLLRITQFDFMFADNRPGTVFVMTAVNPIVNFARKFFPLLFVSLLVILVLTHSLLTYFVSKSIIAPLQLLKKAVKRIKEGDLEFHVDVAGKDEIGQLGVAFEEMRGQLQQSIQTQLQYEENRKELISNISHDLRTPLTAIKGYVDGIQDGVADTPEKAIRYIKTISSKAEEMERLIDELFLFSKLDLKRLPFHFELVGIKAFIADWVEELHLDLEKLIIGCRSEIELGEQTQVMMDRDKLRRVFSNIIDNCVKYMDKYDGQIHLKAWESAEKVTVEISDNGQGIEQEALPHIFERFYRAEQSRNSQTGGSGLGLAIAKQIMEGHGGGISAYSVKGEGTHISITLPIKKA